MAYESSIPLQSESPEAGRPPAAPYWLGDRLVDPRVQDLDRVASVASHLWWLAFLTGIGPFCLLIPVIVWAVRQGASGFSDDHGREALNAQLTLALLVVVPIFWLVLPIWIVVYAVSSVRGAIAAGRREHFRYPMIFRPLR